MTELKLESCIMAAVSALDVDGLAVNGTLSPPDVEPPSTSAVLTVSVGPRSYSRYTVCEASFPVTLELAVRTDTDPCGEQFLIVADAVSELLHTWNMNRSDEAKTALSIPGEMAVGGIRVTGGQAPGIDRLAGVRSMSFTFDVTGFIHPTQNT